MSVTTDFIYKEYSNISPSEGPIDFNRLAEFPEKIDAFYDTISEAVDDLIDETGEMIPFGQ